MLSQGGSLTDLAASTLAPRAPALRAATEYCGRNHIALEHDPEKAWPGRDPGWIPVFRKRSRSNNNLERRDDSKRSHHALACSPVGLLFENNRHVRIRRQANPISLDLGNKGC